MGPPLSPSLHQLACDTFGNFAAKFEVLQWLGFLQRIGCNRLGGPYGETSLHARHRIAMGCAQRLHCKSLGERAWMQSVGRTSLSAANLMQGLFFMQGFIRKRFKATTHHPWLLAACILVVWIAMNSLKGLHCKIFAARILLQGVHCQTFTAKPTLQDAVCDKPWHVECECSCLSPALPLCPCLPSPLCSPTGPADPPP